MTRYIVGRADTVPPGERLIVEIEGRSIGVFNVGGEYFALLNQCPHAGAPLCSHGTLFGAAEADEPDGEVRYTRHGELLRCPWHRWEFDLRTGQSWFDPRNLRVRQYAVDVIPGSPEAVTDPDGGLQQGPHILEGYDVEITDDELLVIDTSRRRQGTQAQRGQ